MRLKKRFKKRLAVTWILISLINNLAAPLLVTAQESEASQSGQQETVTPAPTPSPEVAPTTVLLGPTLPPPSTPTAEPSLTLAPTSTSTPTSTPSPTLTLTPEASTVTVTAVPTTNPVISPSGLWGKIKGLFKNKDLKENKPQVTKANFRSNESVEVVLGDYQDKQLSVSLFSGEKLIENIETKIENGNLKISPPRNFKPGKYTVKISTNDTEDGLVEQDFTWGVLAINTNKSIYLSAEARAKVDLPDEKAYLQMASLDENGHTVCNSSLKLEIRSPDGEAEILTTQDGTINNLGTCGADNVTDIPDYFVYFETKETGTYNLKLTNLDNNYEIEDSFEVKASLPFEVERIGATRINPFKANYTMNFKIKANENFRGEVIETVPASFGILNLAFVSNNENEKNLTWHVDWKAGESYELSYEYDAPDISPQFYLLGPLVLKRTINELEISDPEVKKAVDDAQEDFKIAFEEAREWQIAADADASNGILVWVNNSAKFSFKVWDGTQFGTGATGPALQGTDVVRHLASAVSDDGDYVGVAAEAYNTSSGLHSVYGTVWDVDASAWINTTLLWSFTNTTATNIHQRYFNIVALSNDEFVVVGKEDPVTTLNNAGWLAGTGWTQETDLTTIGSIGKFVDLVRRPDTNNLLLCTKDGASDTNCRYYKGATPYGTSADVNADWTANTEINLLCDDPENWDSHAFFDATDNTRGAVVYNSSSASALTIRARRFVVDGTTITYGNTADSGSMGDDYNKSTVVPVPGQSYALVAAVDIDMEFHGFQIGVSVVTPVWRSIGQLEVGNGMWSTGNDINYHWAAEFDGTRGILAWSETGTGAPVHFRRWTIGGAFEASEQNINNSPNNGYYHTIARRDPANTDEIIFVIVNDDVDINTVWWDGGDNSFATSGNKAWTEQATGLNTAIEDSFHSAEFQFFPASPPISISGNIYTDEAITTYNCTSTNLTVKAVVNGAGVGSTGICTTSGGGYLIENLVVGNPGDVVTIFLDGEIEKATTITKVASRSVGFTVPLYQNRILLSHQNGGPITNANIDKYDSTGDPDIQFTSNGVGLTVNSGNKIVIASGKSYTPGGNIDTPVIGVGGTFTPEANTVTLTASGTGTTCTDAAGTVMPLCLNGGTFTAGTSTINFIAPAANTTLAATNYYNLGVGTSADTGVGVTYVMGGNIGVGGTFTVGNTGSANSDILSASSYTLTLSGSGTPLNITSKGAFTAGTSTVNYNGGDGSLQRVGVGLTYYNLTANTTANGIGRTLQFLGNSTTDVGGTWSITGSSGKVITLQSSDTNNWTINPTAANVTYVDVSKSTNTGVDFCATYSGDGGGNTGWNIAAGSSCSSQLTAYPFQRKTWYDGTRYWKSFNDNGQIEFWYTDTAVGGTWTENTAARIAVNSNDFSIEADSTNAFVAYTNGYDIEARKAGSIGVGYSWGSATIIYDGSTSTDAYSYPSISKDSNNKVWVTTRHYTNDTLTLQPDATDGIDNYIDGSDPTKNGNDTSLSIGHLTGDPLDWTDRHAFIKFNLSSLSGKTISSATFYYYNALAEWVPRGSGYTARILPANSSWTESGSRWNNTDGSTAWAGDSGSDGGVDAGCSQSGTDFDSTVLGSTLMGGTDEAVGKEWSISWSLTEFQEMVDANHGFIFYSDEAGLFACSSDHATAAYRPKLVVEYSSYNFLSIQSSSADDISSWGAGATLDASANTNKYGTLVPVGAGSSANMYAVWIDGTDIEGKKYVGVGVTGWAGSADSIGTGMTGMANSVSLVGGTGSMGANLIYIGAGGSAVYQRYTDSWQTAIVLDTNSGNEYPSISVDNAGGDGIYAFWTRDDDIFYKRACSPYSSWGDIQTLEDTGTNNWLTTGYSTFGSGKIFGQWTSGVSPPYTISWESITPTVCGAASSSTAYPFQRKTWYDGTRYWKSFNANSQIEFWYSLNGTTWTENTDARIAVDTNDFSLEADSSNTFIAYTNGYDIEARKAGSIGVGFSWESATTVYNGTSATDMYDYPTLTRDANNKVWVSSSQTASSTPIFSDGFESGNLGSWTGSNALGTGTTAALQSEAYAGTWSGRFYRSDASDANSMAFVYYDFSAPAGNIVWASCWARFDSIPSSSYNRINTILSLSTSNYDQTKARFHARANSVLQWSYLNKDGTKYSADWGTALSTGTYYGLKVKFDNSGENPVITWYVNSGSGWTQVDQYTDTTAGTAYTPTRLRVGSALDVGIAQPDANYKGTADTRIDEAVVSTSDPDAGGAYKFNAIESVSTNNITSWLTASSLNSSANSNQFGTIVPVGVGSSANMYAVWIDGTAIEGKKYVGVGVTGWGSADSIGTGMTGMTNSLSLVGGTGSMGANLIYVGAGGSAVYQRYTDSWQTAIALDTNSGNEYPSISVDNAGGNGIYAFWVRDNDIFYKRACSPYSSWGDIQTFESTGTNNWLTTGYSTFGSGKIFGQWTSGASPPYTISWESITPTTCGEAFSTSSTATANSFQRKTWYDGTRYWKSFNANSQIEFWYSLNGTTWTENTDARIAVDTNDFSIEADSTNAFISCTNGYDIETLKAKTSAPNDYPDTDFAWSTPATVVYNGTGTGSWWDSSWSYRFEYTITNSGVGETLPNFPLHIDLTTDAPADFWTHVKSDGSDIRIIDENGSTDLSSVAHLEGWDYNNNRGHLWVKRTIAATGDSESVYIYYGNLGASTAFSDTTKQNTYDAYYRAVYHLDETSGQHLDGTSNNVDSTAVTVTQQGADIGVIDGADEFDETDDWVDIDHATAWDLLTTANVTTEAWIKLTADIAGAYANIWGNGGYCFQIKTVSAGNYKLLWNTTSENLSDSLAFTIGTWYHVAIVRTGSTNLKFYRNGAEVKNINNPVEAAEDTGLSSSIGIGGYNGSEVMKGYIDELRVSRTNRSAEWIEFSYLSDKGDAGTAGNEEEPFDEFDYSALTRDSSSKVWVTAVHHSGSSFLTKAIQSTLVNDITTWVPAATLDTSANTNKYGAIVPVGVASSANMYAVWIDGTAIEGKKYVGVGVTGWGSADTIGTGLTGMANSISLVGGTGSIGANLLYIGAGSSAVYRRYTDSWQTAIALDTNSGNEYPSISVDNAGSDGIYAFWTRDNDIFYKRACSLYTSFGDAQTLEDTGTNNWLTTGYSTFGSGKIFGQWTSGASPPYTLSWESITPTACGGAENQGPNSPTSLVQMKIDNSIIGAGTWINSTSISIGATASDPDASDGLYLCVENKTLGVGFTNVEDNCGVGVSYSGTAVGVGVTIVGLSDGTQYHWQVKAKDGAGVGSSWVVFGGGVTRDFGVDTSAPSGGVVYDGLDLGVDKTFNDGSLSSLSANWSGVNTDVSGLNYYEYSIGTGIGSTDVKDWTNIGTGTSAVAIGLTLQTSIMYYFNVRATDNAGNVQSPVISSNGQRISPSLTFSVSPPTLSFDNLNIGNSFSSTKQATLTTSTNAYGGYIIKTFATDYLRSGGVGYTIPDFNGGTYVGPAVWGEGNIGFGYTSSDATIQGLNKFGVGIGGTLYAPISQAGPGDIIADYTDNVLGSPITDDQYTITYKVKTDGTQQAANYSSTVVYTVTAIY